MIELTVPALLATGLAASPHCSLMCGALQVSLLRTRGAVAVTHALLLLQSGRIAGYALLGLAAGGLGQWLLRALPAADWGRWVQLAAAALLIGLGVRQFRSRLSLRAGSCHAPPLPRGLARLAAAPRLSVQGLLWALMPCGLLYAVLGLAALSGSAAFGALLLAAFGLGSSPLLGGAGALVARAGGAPGLRRAGAVALVAMGTASAIAGLLFPAALGAWCRLP